jgi:hypothetical protein
MIDMAHTPANGRLHLVKGGVGMSGVAANAARPTGSDEILGTRQLRGNGRCDDGICISQVLFIFRRSRRPRRRQRMTPARLGGKVRAIEVSAHDSSSARTFLLQLSASFQESEKLIMTGHRGCWQQARRSMSEMGLAYGPKRLLLSIHEIGARPSVDMKINKPWNQVASFQINDRLGRFDKTSQRSLDGFNAIAKNSNAPVGQQAIFKDDGATGEKHLSSFVIYPEAGENAAEGCRDVNW